MLSYHKADMTNMLANSCLFPQQEKGSNIQRAQLIYMHPIHLVWSPLTPDYVHQEVTEFHCLLIGSE